MPRAKGGTSEPSTSSSTRQVACGRGSCARRATARSARARHVFCPSAYLRDVALRWGARPGARLRPPQSGSGDPRAATARRAPRVELAFSGNTLVFAGRLGPQKALDVLLQALTRVPEVALVVAGDGPERAALEQTALKLELDGRVSFLGAVPRERVLRLFRAADASVLPSAWENFPHTVVEALAVGCPLIATAVGGVPEVVRDGENGLLVAPRDPDGPRRGDRALLRGRRTSRAARVRPRRPRSRATRNSSCSRGSSPSCNGRPHEEAVAHGRSLAVRAPAVAVARGEIRRAVGGARRAGARELERRRCDRSSVRAGPFDSPARARWARLLRASPVSRCARAEGLPTRCRARAGSAGGGALRPRADARAGRRPRVIADIHGDPAAPARLYGSRARKALAPLADALARFGLRRSDGVRTISSYTSGLVRDAGVEPTAEFAAFMDLEPFVESPPAPLPERPVGLFVGVLERYKAVDVLADAWRRAAPRVPDATLHLVGRGTLRDVPQALVRDLPAQTRWTESAPHAGGRSRARRVDGSRAPVPFGRPRTSRRRGVLPRPWGRGEPRRRHPRHRRGGRDRPPRSSRTRSTRSPKRSCASSPTERSPSASAPPLTGPCRPGWRRRRSTRGASASSSTRSRASPPTLTRCGRTRRSSC